MAASPPVWERPATPDGGTVNGAGLQVLPQGSAPSVSFMFLLVLLPAVLFPGPLAFAGLTYLRDASAPGRWRWRAAWLGAVAARFGRGQLDWAG